MTTQQTTTQQNTEQNSKSENKNQFKTGENAVLAIRDIENRKETKKMASTLDQFNREGTYSFDWFTDNTQTVALDVKKLGEIHELAKGSKAETIDLTIETDKPAKAQLLTIEREQVGEILIAPKISTEIRQQREEENQQTKKERALDYIQHAERLLEQEDSVKTKKVTKIREIETEIRNNGGENL